MSTESIAAHTSTADALKRNLCLPVICAPLFIVSSPALVIAQCRSGVIGSFPALNARPASALDEWLTQIKDALAADPQAAPFAVNQIVHPSNTRLEHDMEACIRHEVPIVITSLSAPKNIVPHVHAYGGKVFHDVISVRHAEKAIEAGVDGLILVCAGAGGHAGTLSPFALLGAVRKFWGGPIALAGAIANGDSILAAQAMGADFAYMGTRFIGTQEANAVAAYKEAVLSSQATDIVYTPYFTSVHGNYLRQSIIAAGLNPDDLPAKKETDLSLGGDAGPKAWKDIWSAGQGVGLGASQEILPAATVIEQLQKEYTNARARLSL